MERHATTEEGIYRQMHAPKKYPKALAVLGAATALTLASCSGGESDESGQDTGTPSSQSDPAYELQPEGAERSKSVTLKVPDDLLEVTSAEDPEATLMMDSIQIEAHELESADYCAVDLKPDYTKGAVKSLTAEFESGDTAYETEEERLSLNLDIDKSGTSISELDPSDPVDGTYVSKDFQTITVVQECAPAPSDFEDAGNVDFTTQDADGVDDIAEVEFTVMADGTISVLGEAADYVRDSNGDWIRD